MLLSHKELCNSMKYFESEKKFKKKYQKCNGIKTDGEFSKTARK